MQVNNCTSSWRTPEKEIPAGGVTCFCWLCRAMPLNAESMLRTLSRTSGPARGEWWATWLLGAPTFAWTATCTLTTWSVPTHAVYPPSATDSQQAKLALQCFSMWSCLTGTAAQNSRQCDSLQACGTVQTCKAFFTLPNKHACQDYCPLIALANMHSH